MKGYDFPKMSFNVLQLRMYIGCCRYASYVSLKSCGFTHAGGRAQLTAVSADDRSLPCGSGDYRSAIQRHWDTNGRSIARLLRF